MSSNTKKRTTKTVKKTTSRTESKSSQVLGLLKRKGGVTLEELIKATGWQAHSVRGFLAGSVAKKTGAKVASTKGDDGVRRYSLGA